VAYTTILVFPFAGSCQEKLQTIFGMFDIEGRGVLQKADLSRMFRFTNVFF
jgi:Ca2+-binding EF-hand superfamily protein